MIWISLFAFIVFFIYLLYIILRTKKVPCSLSETYYSGGGFLFTLTLWVVSLMMLICMLTCGCGIQCFAFLCCASLMFVGTAPNYLDSTETNVHKISAIVSSVMCILWTLSVNWKTVIVALTVCSIYYLFSLHKTKLQEHILFVLETTAILMTLITYWLIY